jgi:hypothetical protein
MSAEDESDVLEVPFAEIRGEVLAKVINFLRHYQEEAMTKITKVVNSLPLSPHNYSVFAPRIALEEFRYLHPCPALVL